MWISWGQCYGKVQSGLTVFLTKAVQRLGFLPISPFMSPFWSKDPHQLVLTTFLNCQLQKQVWHFVVFKSP